MFFSDEQNLADLKTFMSKGTTDLFDWSKDWEYGMAALTGSANEFKEKVKQTMKGNENEEDYNETLEE